MNPTIQLKQKTSVFLVAFGLACFGLLVKAQAQLPSPSPDGGYPGGNTAEGHNALLSLTIEGLFNTAVGFHSLTANTTGTSNTASGAGTLTSNTTGDHNTADGFGALASNTIGERNTASGFGALGRNTTGSRNVAIGFGAGEDVTTGSGNVYIGAGMRGVAGENNACYIASIDRHTSPSGVAVLIDSNNKLGTITSSRRYKEDITPMNNTSEALFSLKPVTFRYKKELDPQAIQQWGLVAEDVQRVNPALVALDKEGKPYSVRYDQVNSMLLNEFLKEHRTVQNQQKEIDALKAELREQKALIQKVSAQLEVSKAAPRTALNNQ